MLELRPFSESRMRRCMYGLAGRGCDEEGRTGEGRGDCFLFPAPDRLKLNKWFMYEGWR